MKHLDVCTHIDFIEDRDILTRPNFDVNIRLLQSSSSYREIIRDICDYISDLATFTKDGYKTPHGWSGANAGIPFNIIAIPGQVYLNPKIIKVSKERKLVKTNCGSLTLENPVPKLRYTLIDIEYYDLGGIYHRELNIPPNPGFTIQHEIEHTQGILIIDTLNS